MRKHLIIWSIVGVIAASLLSDALAQPSAVRVELKNAQGESVGVAKWVKDWSFSLRPPKSSWLSFFRASNSDPSRFAAALYAGPPTTGF